LMYRVDSMKSVHTALDTLTPDASTPGGARPALSHTYPGPALTAHNHTKKYTEIAMASTTSAMAAGSGSNTVVPGGHSSLAGGRPTAPMPVR
jgi:hypothetical protein